jgi:hypothetical protein
VDKDWNWGGENPTGHFKLLEKLGEGFTIVSVGVI